MKEIELDPVAFIRAGCFLSLTEWVQLGPGEQKAMVEAADALRREHAEQVAEAVIRMLEDIGQEDELVQAADAALGDPA